MAAVAATEGLEVAEGLGAAAGGISQAEAFAQAGSLMSVQDATSMNKWFKIGLVLVGISGWTIGLIAIARGGDFYGRRVKSAYEEGFVIYKPWTWVSWMGDI